MAYPWRAVWRCAARPDGCQNPRFLISVPKKRLKKAVDRVRMRRLMREAYRLGRHPRLSDQPVDIVFIYVADKLTPHTLAQKSVRRILNRIADTIFPQPLATNSTADSTSSPQSSPQE